MCGFLITVMAFLTLITEKRKSIFWNTVQGMQFIMTWSVLVEDDRGSKLGHSLWYLRRVRSRKSLTINTDEPSKLTWMALCQFAQYSEFPWPFKMVPSTGVQVFQHMSFWRYLAFHIVCHISVGWETDRPWCRTGDQW